MGNTYKKKPKTPKNINKEELQKLQAIVKSINEAQFYVGDLEIKKVRTVIIEMKKPTIKKTIVHEKYDFK